MPIATTGNVRSGFIDSFRSKSWPIKDGAEFELGINNKKYKLSISFDQKNEKQISKISISRAYVDENSLTKRQRFSMWFRDIFNLSATKKLEKSLDKRGAKEILSNFIAQPNARRDSIATSLGYFWRLSDSQLNANYNYTQS